MAWIDDWTVVPADELFSPQATAVSTYLATAGHVVRAVEGRRHPGGGEMLVVDILTGVPQRPVVEIERVERIGILFGPGLAMPLIMMLREGFPDTEHQQLVPDGFPAAMCIDDRPWDEARLTWTPAEMLQRIHLWFRRAARGELHDPIQPVDPFFGLSRLKIVVPASVLSDVEGVELVGFRTTPDDADLFTVMPAGSLPKAADVHLLIPVAYRVPPERMSRMRKAPQSLAALAAILDERGVDMLGDLTARMSAWAGSEEKDRARLNGVLAIIVAFPVVAPDGSTRGGLLDLRVFITLKSVGEIGVALGQLHAHDDAAASGFARAILAGDVDEAFLAACPIEMAQVHRAFDAEWAATLAGRTARDERKVVMVGAGAIGSHVAEYLVREGRFDWTVVDDDRLLPHNLARHTLRAMENGSFKATALANRLNSIFLPTTEAPVARSIDANVLRPGQMDDELRQALAAASVIIDASASIAASRHLADVDVGGRRASVFFNPSAEAVVAIVEPEDRSLTLRDLEAQYYRAVLQRPELERHLTAVGQRFAYTGACRAVTNRVPASRIALLSSLVAAGLAQSLGNADATIRVWSTDMDGRVSVSDPDVAPVTRYPLLNWEITVDEWAHARMVAMRDGTLPSETGGSAIGIVDSLARKVHLVEPLPAPPDSKGSPRGFERGIAGLSDDVTGRLARTMDQLQYIGEWHSHPPDCPLTPSPTDVVQLCRSAMKASLESLPALSFIIGDEGLNVLLGEVG
ncbi:ThiF family adenylyltransferase [Methylobacterium sp. J-092]|uniref:ThiF family adenylyltransferase n=1 Tax=Methylobacterium sp. J-092 TaxID=2836667 RepID=UPI001FBA9831|nr:ThiF family adenylyltransferase [Methylobacterium sp. J-092]MCJ2009583.1 ThiF family adenylyltransferase [Methylobacterium sp. J-092]